MLFTSLENYDLDRLDSFLCSPERPDDVMLLEQLDGYLTAIALAPHAILPSEWLPGVWDQGGPVFADQEEAQAIYGAIMGLYNDNLRALADPHAPFEPIFAVDLDDSVLVEPWAEGFMSGVALRQDDWQPLMKDEAIAGAIAMVAAVSFTGAEDGASPVDMTRKQRERLLLEAPRLIPLAVRDIREFWSKMGLAPGPPPVRPGPTIKSLWLLRNDLEAEDDEPWEMPARSTKVGRNEPCPCGSGKKSKRCCGAA